MTAIERRKLQLEQYRDWLHSHPHRVDPEVQPAAIDFLNGRIAELDEPTKNKNAFPARKTLGLRDRLKYLVTLIVAQSQH